MLSYYPTTVYISINLDQLSGDMCFPIGLRNLKDDESWVLGPLERCVFVCMCVKIFSPLRGKYKRN